jgi:hypothetical protein
LGNTNLEKILCFITMLPSLEFIISEFPVRFLQIPEFAGIIIRYFEIMESYRIFVL